MFSCGNIQSRPTPTIFQRRSKSDILALAFGGATVALAASALREIVVNVATVSTTGVSSLALKGSELRSVIVPLAPVVAEAGLATISMTGSVLRSVITPFASPPSTGFACLTLTTSEVKTVVISVPTIQITEPIASINLQSAILA